MEIKGLIRHASEEARVSPIFTDERIQAGDNILQTFRTLVLSCDIVVAVIRDYVPAALILEIDFIRALGKPFTMFARKPVIPLFHPRMRYLSLKYEIIYYKELRQLRRLLTSSIKRISSVLRNREYLVARKDENNLVSMLKKSLDTNVLVIGKDSDPIGLQKISRIKDVLRKGRYHPLSLKDLPEIKHLSLEGKMIRIGALSRFVIAEDSRPSGHISELNTCVKNEYVTAMVRVAGSGSTWMLAHYPIIHPFTNLFCYLDGRVGKVVDQLCEKIFPTLEDSTEEAIRWAEDYITTLERKYSKKIYSNF